MTDQNKAVNDDGNDADEAVGGAHGGAAAGGPGNILGAVQPSNENGGGTQRRHD